MTTSAHGPGYGNTQPLAVDTASLSFSGTDVIITGSIDQVFRSDTFVGPNEAEKRDRQRITVDVASFSSGFETERAHLAALRTPAKSPDAAMESQLADAGLLTPDAETEIDVEARVEVAAIDPALASQALDAISGIDQTIPMPMLASEQLAYARATAPVTDLTTPKSTYSEKELWCLATAIYFEARGETYRGQVAVGQVVMNRVAHRLYPDTICGVVFQGQSKRNACQFSFACDGIPETISDKTSWTQAQEIALGITAGTLYLTEVEKATHYHATYVYPHWAPKLKKVVKIGHHVFYKFKRA